MSDFKRNRDENTKLNFGASRVPKPVPANAYTPMFEHFRDELDEHHDRRDRLGKASRDVTALSKKIIFALQRVRLIGAKPDSLDKENNARLEEISKLVAAMAADLQGINRYRYSRSMCCIEELVEALTFDHYLGEQSLATFERMAASLDELIVRGNEALAREAGRVRDTAMPDAGDATTSAPKNPTKSSTIPLSVDEYLGGVFDLTGEMMRFATVSTALSGSLAGTETGDYEERDGAARTILQDMQELGTFFEMLPGSGNSWNTKLEVLRQSVRKVEKLGYDRTVRGGERPEGWVPDTSEAVQGQDMEE